MCQIVSYDVGGFYSEHYDNKAGGVISRAATIIVYLQDTPEGGATYFPKWGWAAGAGRWARGRYLAVVRLSMRPSARGEALHWSRLCRRHDIHADRPGLKWTCNLHGTGRTVAQLLLGQFLQLTLFAWMYTAVRFELYRFIFRRYIFPLTYRPRL